MKKVKSWKIVAALASILAFAGCSSDDSSSGNGSEPSAGPKNAHVVKFNAEGTWNAESFNFHRLGGSENNGVITGEAYVVFNQLVNPAKDHVIVEADVTVVNTSGHNGLGLISVKGSDRLGYALITGQNIKHTGCTLGGGGNGLSPAVSWAGGTEYRFKAEYKDGKENYYVYDLSGNLLGKNEGIAQSHAATDLVYPAFGGTTAAYSNYKNMSVTINGQKYIIDGVDEMSALASVSVSSSTVRMLLNAEATVTYNALAAGGTFAGADIAYDSEYLTIVDDGAGTLKITGKKPTTSTTITLTNKSNSSFKTTITVVVEDFAAADDYGTIASDALYPAVDATNAYYDGELRIKFDGVPTLSPTGAVSIYKENGDFVDVILADNEVLNLIGSDIKVLDQMMRVEGNNLYIKIRPGTLEPSTKYFVAIPRGVVEGTFNGKDFTGFSNDKDVATWSFTTKAAVSASSTMTVNCAENATADFRTIQAALDAIGKDATGDYTIEVAAGTYYELVQFNGKANITIAGPANYVRKGKPAENENCKITWANNNKWNPSMDTRATMFIHGTGNIVLKNITVENSTNRADPRLDGTQETQAEAIYLKSSGLAAVNNCSFYSYQDTICTRSDKAWFYDCYVEGDVDYLWGYSNVCLFENCDFLCLNDPKRTTKQSILYVARVATKSANTVGKGYVLYNSTVKVQDGIKIYFARNAGAGDFYDQGALVNVAITLDGAAAIEDTVSKPNDYTPLAEKGDKIGWKNYGVKVNSSALSMSGSIESTISDDDVAKEYNGRNAILNRVYNISGDKFQNATSVWDISDLETAFGATPDTSEIDEEVAFAPGAKFIYDFVADASTYSGSVGSEKTSGPLTWNCQKWKNDTYGFDGKPDDTFKFSVIGSVRIGVKSTYQGNNYDVTKTGSGTLDKTKTTSTATGWEYIIYTASNPEEEAVVTLKGTAQNYCGAVSVESIPFVGTSYDYNFLADADAIDFYKSKVDKKYSNGFLTWNTAVKHAWQGDTFGFNVGTNDYFTVTVLGSSAVTIYSSYGAASYDVTTTGAGSLDKNVTTKENKDIVIYTAASDDEVCTITFKSKGQNYCNRVTINPIPKAGATYDYNFLADAASIAYYTPKVDKEYSNGFLTWNTVVKHAWQGDTFGFNVGTNDYFIVTVKGNASVTIYSSYGAASYDVTTTGAGSLDKNVTTANDSETVTYTADSADEVCSITFKSKGQNYCNRVKIN